MGWFSKVKSFLDRAFRIAKDKGLTDDIVEKALALVQAAEVQFSDNSTKRSWVITALVAAGIPESVARIAVELALQLFKKSKTPA